ncbi:MAG: phenylalanine--tRNA ligase subunit beta [Phycisphaeraceae bacterium]|nr:phenylalanine--tRNA ligase subunit beta [Phycisphaeraceae bacterium]
MKVSLAWLNEYLDPHVSADEVERRLTAQGLPIETREKRSDGDEMLDVEVTSNRADCLSHVGVAREVAAGSGRALKLPDIALLEKSVAAVESITSVANDRFDLCPLYTARVIRGIKIGPSPAWLVKRLETIGQRSVNNVVDITNYVLFASGQPLHAFDLSRLAGRKIVIRTARNAEQFDAIDGTKHKLTDQMLVIADADKPVALAGVMGGVNSEVTSSTTEILLESAIFDPLAVRRASRALKLASDSSYRFERGIDPHGVEEASRWAAALILELAGGEAARGIIRVGSDLPPARTVSMRVSRAREITGLNLDASQMVDLLATLGLAPRLDAAQQTIACVVPSFRLDLAREIDLIEELARLHGLDDVPVRQKIEIVARPVQPAIRARRVLGDVLVAHGYHETINFSFIAPRLGESFAASGEQPLLIEDERRKNDPMLRPSLLPSLLSCRKSNQDVGNTHVRIFETASVWSKSGRKTIERRRLGLLADAADAQQAVRDLRGTIEELVSSLGGSMGMTCKPTTSTVFTSAAEVCVGDQVIGVMGAISSATQKLFDLQTPLVAAELELDLLLASYPPKHQVSSLTRFPGIERDISIVLDEAVTWEQVSREVIAAQPALLEDLRFLVTYRGKPIPAGKKSVSLRMFFRDPTATLRHEQVDPQVGAVVERLKATLGAELRA